MLHDDRNDREARAREDVRRTRRNVEWLFSKEGNREFFRRHLERQDPSFLLLAAREGDAESIALLRKYARGARQHGMKVPEDLHAFVWEYFIDGPPKKKPGSDPRDHALKELGMALLVNWIVEQYGFPEYCAPEHRGDPAAPMTACRLVAEEFGLSERTVETIWADRKAGVATA